MAVKFGSLSGRRESENLQIRDGELVCGERVFTFIRSIEKSYTYDDEFFTCSIGVETANTEICLEEASLRLSEEAQPKYKPEQDKIGITVEEAENLGYQGEALTTLACPIKVRTVTIEVSARYRGDGQIIIPVNDILNATTADGAERLIDLVQGIPTNLRQVLTDKSVDKPIDDFITQNVTYRAKISYPQTRPQFDQANQILGTSFDKNNSTVRIDASLRQQDTPTRRISFNVYGLKKV